MKTLPANMAALFGRRVWCERKEFIGAIKHKKNKIKLLLVQDMESTHGRSFHKCAIF